MLPRAPWNNAPLQRELAHCIFAAPARANWLYCRTFQIVFLRPFASELPRRKTRVRAPVIRAWAKIFSPARSLASPFLSRARPLVFSARPYFFRAGRCPFFLKKPEVVSGRGRERPRRIKQQESRSVFCFRSRRPACVYARAKQCFYFLAPGSRALNAHIYRRSRPDRCPFQLQSSRPPPARRLL